tara:strand:+ start:1375 stop:1554 length:180 start_codon:yes stop_codon:yes gene_type:complete
MNTIQQDDANQADFMFYEIRLSRELCQVSIQTQHLADYVAMVEGVIIESRLHEMAVIRE